MDEMNKKNKYVTEYAALNERLKSYQQDLKLVCFLNGKDGEGDEFWAYISVPMNKYDEFCLSKASGDFDIFEYGDIIDGGSGLNPPAKVKKRIEKEYQLDEGFEEELENLMEELEFNEDENS